MLNSRYVLLFLVAFFLTTSLYGQGTSAPQGSGAGGGMDVYQSYKQKKNYVFHPRPYIPPNKPNGQNGYYGQNGPIYQSWKSRG